MFSSQQRFYQIKHALTLAGISCTPEDKWMMMPDMGFLLSGNKGYSETFFPLEGASPEKERLMCLGWVN
ncbi:protein FAR1-RELATED SEQUENCE 5, partial [Trifolium medium]|nr:protein FAR1-RELATED SEQUENCE 5 [Trifolium medium]